MKLSLIIPCYDEEDNINKLYNECEKSFLGSGFSYEYIFVNDGSKDKTYEVAQHLYETKTLSNIKVINFSRNFGKEAAMYAGLQNASGDLICLIDADLQQHPSVVLQMVKILDEDDSIDCVTAYQQERKENKFKSFTKSLFYKLMNKITDIDFVNGASDFRCFRSYVKDAILSMPEYHRFSKGIFSWVGYNVKYIPYCALERNSGKTKWSLGKLIKYAVDGIVAFSTAPLRIATYSGIISAVLSLVYMIVVIVQRLFFDMNIPGYATIVVLLLFIGGVQLFCMGVIGEYVSKIYIQSKNRPVFIIKNILK